MKELVSSRLSELQTKPFAELSKLDEHESERIQEKGKKIHISIWTDKIGDNALQVVVQAYRPLFLGFGKMYAQGFRINKSNEVSVLQAEDLYDFV